MCLQQRNLGLSNKRRYSQVRTFTGQWTASMVPSFIYESESCLVVSDSLRSHGLYSPWNSLGQNTGVGSLSLLQQIFSTQELNWGLLHCRRILYQLSYEGSLPLYIFCCFTKSFSFGTFQEMQFLNSFCFLLPCCALLKLLFSALPTEQFCCLLVDLQNMFETQVS